MLRCHLRGYLGGYSLLVLELCFIAYFLFFLPMSPDSFSYMAILRMEYALDQLFGLLFRCFSLLLFHYREMLTNFYE